MFTRLAADEASNLAYAFYRGQQRISHSFNPQGFCRISEDEWLDWLIEIHDLRLELEERLPLPPSGGPPNGG